MEVARTGEEGQVVDGVVGMQCPVVVSVDVPEEEELPEVDDMATAEMFSPCQRKVLPRRLRGSRVSMRCGKWLSDRRKGLVGGSILHEVPSTITCSPWCVSGSVPQIALLEHLPFKLLHSCL